MASWLVSSTPDRAVRVPVRVRALAGDIVLCSWARHFTLTAPLSIQVYKWVPTNLMLGSSLKVDKDSALDLRKHFPFIISRQPPSFYIFLYTISKTALER